MANHDGISVPDHPNDPATVTAGAKPSDEQMKKDIHDGVVKIAFSYARQMTKAARNPESFVLEQALLINATNDVCYTYRAQNGFGGMSREYAILDAKTLKFYMSSQSGFHTAWNKHCNDKNGEDISTEIQP